MSSDWKLYKIKDIGEVVGGGTPSTQNEKFWNGEIPWLSPKDLTGYTDVYISKGERNISTLGLQKSSAKLLPKGTVLFSSRAPIGYVAIANNPICTNQGFKSIIPNNEIALPEFVYYWLKYNTDFLKGLGSGTTFAEISGTTLKEVDIKLPSIKYQQKIVNTLLSLDLKTTNNKCINSTLEEIAQALFKSWFVDFEPVKAKLKAIQEGKDPQLAAMCAISGKTEEELQQLPQEKKEELAKTAELFPDKLVESELGLIPEGWSVNKLGELTSLLSRGITPKYEEEGVVVINQRCIRDQSIDFENIRYHNEELREIKSKEVYVGDVLINSTGVGTLGRVAIVKRLHGRTTVDTHVTIVRADTRIVNADYLGYFLLINESTIEEMGEGSTGQTELKRTVLSEMKLVNADLEVQKQFSKIVKSTMSAISNNEKSNQKLKITRDTLLPKLLSGELNLT